MTTRHLTISDLSPRHQAEVMRQINAGKPIGIARAEQVRAVEVQPKRLRQAAVKLNKTEAAFALWLREHKPDAQVHEQGLTLRLAAGCRYTVDFVAVEFAPAGAGRIVTAYEVKGGLFRDDAVVKLKVAASLYRWINFVLVSKRRDGTWAMEDVIS